MAIFFLPSKAVSVSLLYEDGTQRHGCTDTGTTLPVPAGGYRQEIESSLVAQNPSLQVCMQMLPSVLVDETLEVKVVCKYLV